MRGTTFVCKLLLCRFNSGGVNRTFFIENLISCPFYMKYFSRKSLLNTFVCKVNLSLLSYLWLTKIILKIIFHLENESAKLSVKAENNLDSGNSDEGKVVVASSYLEESENSAENEANADGFVNNVNSVSIGCGAILLIPFPSFHVPFMCRCQVYLPLAARTTSTTTYRLPQRLPRPATRLDSY